MNVDANLIRRLARDSMKRRNERGLYVLGLCHALQATDEPECVALAAELLKTYFPSWRVKPTSYMVETSFRGVTIER
jgi:hypothetical protein